MYLDFLITCLSRRHFVSTGSKSVTNERHLTALSDAFCGAYAENDCVTLKLCIDFVKELSEDLTQQRDQMREKLMHIIKQLFCAADFSEGKYLCNNDTKTFLNLLFDSYVSIQERFVMVRVR